MGRVCWYRRSDYTLPKPNWLKIPQSYRDQLCPLADYWVMYGGMKAMVSSPYFGVSLALTAMTVATWFGSDWWTIPAAILPNIIGFTIGGYAILVSFGDEDFKQRIAGKWAGDDGHSPYMIVNASLVHAILVQIAALVASVVFKSIAFLSYYELKSFWLAVPGTIIGGFSFFLFIYSLVLLMPLALNIFEVANWYDAHQTTKRRNAMAKEQAAEVKQTATQHDTPPVERETV